VIYNNISIAPYCCDFRGAVAIVSVICLAASHCHVFVLDVQSEPKKYRDTKITISQKCANVFELNFAHLFGRQLCISVLLCAVFT